LVPQRACKDHHRFIVGSCSLHDANELNVLHYYDDSNRFDIVQAFHHPDQIWALESCPYDSSLVITSHQNLTCFKSLTLWKLPHQSLEEIAEDIVGSHQREELQEITSFNQSQQMPLVTSIQWHPHQHQQLLTVDHKIMIAWHIRESVIEVNICYLFNCFNFCLIYYIFIF
jgi:hypothetical protein